MFGRRKYIRLFYVGSKGINMGDSINPILFERLWNIKIKRGYPTNCDVIGVGSILQMLQLKNIIKYKKYPYLALYSHKPVIIMGGGFRGNEIKSDFMTSTYRKVIPLVLRGKLSHCVLEKINNQSYSNVTYGDLGILFPLLTEKKITKKYELGIVPHKYDYNNEKLNYLKNLSKNHTIIDLRNDPMDSLIKIAECETVISSSLHGLIAADSLNIPNIRIKLSNHGLQSDIDFKFNDYYSIFCKSDLNVNETYSKYIDFTKDCNTDELNLLLPQNIANNYKIKYSDVEKHRNILLKKGEELKEILCY